MSIQQLIYTSRAADHLLFTEVLEILRRSQSKNHDRHISGLLLFKDGLFLQLLEGPENSVQNIFSSIQADPRHNQIRVLLDTVSDTRAMPAWVMGFSSPDMTARLTDDCFVLPFDEFTDICRLLDGDAGQLFRNFINGHGNACRP